MESQTGNLSLWARTTACALLGFAGDLAAEMPAPVDTDVGPAAALVQEARSQYQQQEFSRARDSYQRAILLLEQHTGAVNPALVEPLVGLADTFIATEQPAGAVEPLRRAVSVVRRHAGIYNQQQYTLLERLVDVQSSIGDIDAAAADLTYMERVSESTSGKDSPEHARALALVADWQCRIGRFVQARESYRRSIDGLEESAHAEMLVGSLRGLAQCCLQELAYEGIATTEESLDRYRGPTVRSGRMSPSNPAFRTHFLKYLRVEGEQALQRAVRVSESLEADQQLPVLLQAGDWFTIKDFTRTARRFYAKAQALASAAAPASPDHPLATPQQVLYPLPATALRYRHLPLDDAPEYFIEVEFTVRADGQIVDERVVKRQPGKMTADETLAALRVSRFRPRIVDGSPVVTEGVRLRQSFRDVSGLR